MTLALLCLAALALSALVVSALVAALLAGLDRALGALAPAHRPTAWLLVIALPALASALLIGAALLPSGFDHCLAHDPHHPHLCVRHLQSAPAAALLALAGFMIARLTPALARTAIHAFQIRAVRHTLAASTIASTIDDPDCVHIIDDPTPHAFALGGARPGIYLSRSLLALGPAMVEPVLARPPGHAHRGRFARRISLARRGRRPGDGR